MYEKVAGKGMARQEYTVKDESLTGLKFGKFGESRKFTKF